MTVKQQNSGKWLCHINKQGFKRIRRLFDDEKAANIFNRYQLSIISDQQFINSDSRTLNELIKLWFKYHGMTLSDGQRRNDCLLAISADLGNPVARQITPDVIMEYRFKRINAGLSAKTFNNHQGYLAAMFNRLRKLKVIDYDNPIDGVEFIKIQELQLSYLSTDQISTLLEDIKQRCHNKSTFYVAGLCIRTGARWSEAEKLTTKQLHRGMVTFEKTKSKKIRSVPLEKKFYEAIKDLSKNKNPNQRIFSNCIGSFRRAVNRMQLDLPPGQCSHVLRHSFASHFIMNGGNILTLQKILGHADITTTLKYAHLSPDHLNDAVKFNPIK